MTLNTSLKQQGYLHLQQPSYLHRLLSQQANAFKRFQYSWSLLYPDNYLRDGGQYRKRRYSVFLWDNKQLQCLPYEPHYQNTYQNRLHGGYNRHYRQWSPLSYQSMMFHNITHCCVQQFSPNPHVAWRIQAHQFRITASPQSPGKPTPEGIHRDGADFILIMLVGRHNVRGGISRIYDNSRQPLDEVTLEQPGDSILLHDRRLYHSVSPIYALDEQTEAWRDVMVLTFHRTTQT